MTHIFFIIILLYSNFCFAGKSIIQDHLSIYNDTSPESLEERCKMGYLPVSLMIKNLQSQIKEDDPVKYVSLGSCCIDDDALEKLKEEFFDQISESVEIIDLSHNFFTIKSNNTLEAILRFPNLKFLNLTGTNLSLKNIRQVVEPLKLKDPDMTLRKKLIFMEKTYISDTETRVKLYKKLAQEKLISDQWGRIHREFYDLDKHYREQQSSIEIEKDSGSDELLKLLKALNIKA